MKYDINDPNVVGPQTWEEIGSPLQPFDVARYELAEPYHPDKANAEWEVTSISVLMIGPSSYRFLDQDGNCLNPGAVFWGRLPIRDEILDFLQNME
jgi:hypothetical protein